MAIISYHVALILLWMQILLQYYVQYHVYQRHHDDRRIYLAHAAAGHRSITIKSCRVPVFLYLLFQRDYQASIRLLPGCIHVILQH